MNKKLLLIFVFFILIIVATISIFIFRIFSDTDSEGLALSTTDIMINENRLPSDISELELVFFPVEADEFGSIGFGIWDGYIASEHSIDPIRLETPQDRLNISLTNDSVEEINVIIKVFYNYQEATFRIVGSETYVTEFIFTMPGGYDVDIPFHLDPTLEAGETLSKLTVAVFPNPENFTMQEQESEDSVHYFHTGLVLDFEINYGSDLPLSLSVPESDTVDDVHDMWGIFTVNAESEPVIGGGFMPPPYLLQVTPNEQVELAFFGNMSVWEMVGMAPHGEAIERTTEITDYLIISMLDWQQIPMNGDPYLWLRGREGERGGVTYGQHGRFYIEAPSEPGFYEFVAFLVHNPKSSFAWETFVPLEVATRFTIEVVE